MTLTHHKVSIRMILLATLLCGAVVGTNHKLAAHTQQVMIYDSELRCARIVRRRLPEHTHRRLVGTTANCTKCRSELNCEGSHFVSNVVSTLTWGFFQPKTTHTWACFRGLCKVCRVGMEENRDWLKTVLTDAKKHYDQGYPNSYFGGLQTDISRYFGGRQTKTHGVTVKRPNHDLTHAARKAMNILNVVEAILNKYTDVSRNFRNLKRWLTSKTRNPERKSRFYKKLQLTMIWSRAGRKSEASGSDVKNRLKHEHHTTKAECKRRGCSSFIQNMPLLDKHLMRQYKITSAELLEAQAKIHCPGEDMREFQQAIGAFKKSSKEAEYLQKIFHAAHMLDYLRLSRDVNNKTFRDNTGLGNKIVDRLRQTAQLYIKKTGGMYGKGWKTKKFARCHSNIDFLLDQLSPRRRT